MGAKSGVFLLFIKNGPFALQGVNRQVATVKLNLHLQESGAALSPQQKVRPLFLLPFWTTEEMLEFTGGFTQESEQCHHCFCSVF